ncbi:hypothetical protein FJW04_24095 [Mesorhizobium sp. B2-7-3]|uniref:hypothetical protein n=1 Tax=Mesorhizobium sp. B2-7-3 TaxID=2589907 RepID=UPI001126DC70|nr:hypothetical protein [Mesorhizobium sp. B2-7-3]TPJ11442.1 hypothetical protein FJW04_24095 [Mesorhizobium sp. B2-7-3]
MAGLHDLKTIPLPCLRGEIMKSKQEKKPEPKQPKTSSLPAPGKPDQKQIAVAWGMVAGTIGIGARLS